MIDWVARITKVYAWSDKLEDADMAKILQRTLIEIERTLLDDSKDAEDTRQKLWIALRETHSHHPLWPQRREFD
tara:strand:+ start:426 stop:647 length:222 start_codon:yes stop_codon:yes gene_type:complete